MEKQTLLLEEKIKEDVSEEAFLKCRDYTVSGKDFQIRYSPQFEMLVTSPAPSFNELPEFYKSEEYISHTDSSRSLFEKVYQGVKSFMLDKKLKWIEKEKKDRGNILDIGAGTGDFLSRAKSRGWKVHGVEPNSGARELASKKTVDLKENSKSFASESFDVITMWHVLEHVPDLEDQLKELQRLLKPNGLLVIAVPNFKSFDAEVYKQYWAAFDVPRHLWHFSSSSIKRIFSSFSFELKKTEPLKFDSYYVSLLSEKYKTGSSKILSGLRIGFLSNWKARKSHQYSSRVYFLEKKQKNAK